MMPSVNLQNKSPYEILYSKLPEYSSLRVFGCLCYIYSKNEAKDKFNSRGIKCVFLGYLFCKKGYRVLSLENKKTYVTRDVTFVET